MVLPNLALPAPTLLLPEVYTKRPVRVPQTIVAVPVKREREVQPQELQTSLNDEKARSQAMAASVAHPNANIRQYLQNTATNAPLSTGIRSTRHWVA